MTEKQVATEVPFLSTYGCKFEKRKGFEYEYKYIYFSFECWWIETCINQQQWLFIWEVDFLVESRVMLRGSWCKRGNKRDARSKLVDWNLYDSNILIQQLTYLKELIWNLLLPLKPHFVFFLFRYLFHSLSKCHEFHIYSYLRTNDF